MAKRNIKIDSLTPEQTARMAEFRDEWTKIGLCTDPADRPQAEAAIRKMYECAGLPPPQKIVWCGSPLTAGLTRAIILDKKTMKDIGDSVWDSVGANVGTSVRDSVWASVWDSVGANVGTSVRDSVWASVGDSVRVSVGDSVWVSVWASVRVSVGDSVRDSVWDSVWDSVRNSVGDSVRDSVWDSVWDSVRDSVGDSVRDSVWDSVRDSVRDSVYSQHDAAWLAFYRYFHDVCELVAQTQKLEGLWLLARSAGWVLPHQNICWVSERHNLLMRDERGLLHSLNGPAVAFPDGWAIYAVHGLRVPAWIIEEPHKISIKTIESEQNIEVRRIMIERYGEERYIIDSGMKPVAKDAFGELYVQNMQVGRPIAKVRVTNATAEPDGSFRSYWIPINPSLYGGDAGRIPQAAVASTWRTARGGEELLFRDWRKYQPSIET